MNVCNLLDQAARRFPAHGAVYVGIDLHLSYAALRERAFRLGTSLRVRHGEAARIAIASENCAAFIELLFGIWAAGQAVVPINYKLHPKEMAQIAQDAGVSAIFVSPAIAEGLQRAMEGQVTVSPALIVVGGCDYDTLFDAEPAAVPTTAPDALAWLFFTSGTTGRSKGAMLSHRNLLAMSLAHLADVETFDEGASQIHAAPMSHGSGLYILPYVSRGARHVVPASSGFDPDEFLDLCDSHPSCGAFLAPTMVQRLRRAVESSGRSPPKHLRSVMYGGGPMYVDELKKALRVFGQVFVQIYGQGESPMTITCLRRADHACDDDAVLGSVGWARTGVQVAVINEHGKSLPEGEIGEIVCCGDVVMSGYWNDPGATSATLRDGWLYTGDMGSLDARGYLTLRDRSKDVVISGGSNIYPREVEEALLSHSAVAEVCVVGQIDDEWGEVVVAFVVLEPGASVAAGALDAHCLDRIARFKKPKRYLFVNELPKNSYGKVLKRALRQRLLPGGDVTDTTDAALPLN